jgi:hypothetical protein
VGERTAVASASSASPSRERRAARTNRRCPSTPV